MRYAVILTNMIREDAVSYCRAAGVELAIDSVGQFLALTPTEELAHEIESEMVIYNNDFDPIKRKKYSYEK